MFNFIDCKKDRKKWHNHECAVISVSMLSPNHSGEKFEKIIDWFNQQDNFKKCIIYVADTLNRHNHMLVDNSSEAEAIKKARRFGDKWVMRHRSAFSRIKVPHFVVRWDHYLENKNFKKVRESYLNLYETNKLFKDTVRQDINSFFARRGIHSDRVLPKEYKHHFNYVIEELSADTLLYNSYPAAWIYPGKELESYKILRMGKVDCQYKGLQNYNFVRLLGQNLEPKNDQEITQKKVA